MTPNCISVASIRTPRLGIVWAAASDHGLVAVEFGVRREAFEASLRRQLGSRQALEHSANETLESVLCQIAEYLDGRRQAFDTSIDWSVLGSEFQRAALRAVIGIPYGQTRTYGQIAAQIGYPQAPRAVGRANATNPMPLVVPCHRVIGSDGKLHGYGGAGGLKTKQWLLDMERMATKQEPAAVG